MARLRWPNRLQIELFRRAIEDGLIAPEKARLTGDARNMAIFAFYHSLKQFPYGDPRNHGSYGRFLIDLTGETFGKLTVLEREPLFRGKKKPVYWKCECECGNIRIVRSSDLRNGRIKSCHYCVNPFGRGRHLHNLIGKNFGKWTVLNHSGKIGHHTYWECKCDCGTKRNVCSHSITSGKSTSCGCDRENHNLINLIGCSFGYLTVLERATYHAPSRKTKAYWKCRCVCGNHTVVLGASLRHGRTESCGCLRRNKTSRIQKNELQELLDQGLDFKAIGAHFDLHRTTIRDLCKRLGLSKLKKPKLQHCCPICRRGFNLKCPRSNRVYCRKACKKEAYRRRKIAA